MAEKPPKRSGGAGAGAKKASPRRAAARPGGAARSHGPTPVVPTCPSLRAGRPADPPPRRIPAPTGGELVTTTIRAAGELAQIGVSAGGRMVKRTLKRFPRP
jgi:hypothetical protein